MPRCIIETSGHPICENVPKVRHRAMGCPYRPPSLPLLKPAGHGAPRRAQRKRTRPLRRPAHPSGWLRCAPACAVEGGAAPAAGRGRVRRRLVLRAPLPQGAAAWPREPCASAASAPERWHHGGTCVTGLSFQSGEQAFRSEADLNLCCQKTVYPGFR